MTKYYSNITTKLGDILLLSDSENITGLYFVKEKYIPQLKLEWQNDSELEILKLAEKQLKEYSCGNRRKFEIPYSFIKFTEFQKKVWEELSKIPYGKTITYKELANNIGASNSIRAVAAAVGRNPISLIVPCHRVIGSNNSLTGYAGGIELKHSILTLEGIRNITI
ncbi:methylated-DNA/protein-cysteine methyltransferase [endosymbiont of Acanthamoeba sp. UWC8]|uniref:methylated-DNA--[protein]-cysteine S-methyltransferase n=1 Tax=endosymbiont of Acanthamoeba sp. UWC8 TaxID=86106 RepID=UPI0004D1A347|nr:methylated-DNA--[protein]-cysteine S-methyltransferase [endosymbiont of Acanthamoeba sp. UWC8]AIF81318.1 methylated-DNA/protein-cysteine methyltransferase [endosymbiont of Acanthamoeba sp. UWC8]